MYFRLVKERDAEAKRLAFESAIAALRAGHPHPHPQILTYKQSDFDAIPGKPWVYWMGVGVKQLFRKFPLLGSVAPAVNGLTSSDNFRFVRSNWEVGKSRINRGCQSREQAADSGDRWFPYMKGGTPVGWYGNQTLLMNWFNDGVEVKNENSFPRSQKYYFRRGVTWSLIASKGFAARLSPGGFIFDVAGMTCFPPEDLIPMTLAVLNSPAAKFILSALNPTINYQVGDILRLPVPGERSPTIVDLVTHCVELARQDSRESETTYDVVAPLRRAEARAERRERLRALEYEIDAEISRLYRLSEEDLAAIDRELSDASVAQEDENAEATVEEEDADVQSLMLSQAESSRRWISYAVGTVLGRFETGMPGCLGCGDFSEPSVTEIRKLVDADGIMLCEAGHPQDLASRALACLNLMLGTDAAGEVIRSGLGEGDPLDTLRGWLDRFTGQPAQSFWRYHFQQHRKRPVYWPFQSPDRRYTAWVFHEKIGPDTLFRIRNEFVEPRLRLAEREIADLRVRSVKDRRAAKELDRMLDFAADLGKFAANLKAIAERGYAPQIDDGVLLNAAPLHEVLPSWPDTRAAWNPSLTDPIDTMARTPRTTRGYGVMPKEPCA